MQFLECPRCGDQAFEHLESIGQCVSCFYSTDEEVRYVQIPVEVLSQKEIMSTRPQPTPKRAASEKGAA
jgi:ribosomal protein L37E